MKATFKWSLSVILPLFFAVLQSPASAATSALVGKTIYAYYFNVVTLSSTYSYTYDTYGSPIEQLESSEITVVFNPMIGYDFTGSNVPHRYSKSALSSASATLTSSGLLAYNVGGASGTGMYEGGYVGGIEATPTTGYLDFGDSTISTASSTIPLGSLKINATSGTGGKNATLMWFVQ